MTLLERLIEQTGDTTGAIWSFGQMASALTDAISIYSARRPRVVRTTLTPVPSVQTVALPADCKRVREAYGVGLHEIERVGTSLMLYPVPTESWPITLDYEAEQTEATLPTADAGPVLTLARALLYEQQAGRTAAEVNLRAGDASTDAGQKATNYRLLARELRAQFDALVPIGTLP